MQPEHVAPRVEVEAAVGHVRVLQALVRLERVGAGLAADTERDGVSVGGRAGDVLEVVGQRVPCGDFLGADLGAGLGASRGDGAAWWQADLNEAYGGPCSFPYPQAQL